MSYPKSRARRSMEKTAKPGSQNTATRKIHGTRKRHEHEHERGRLGQVDAPVLECCGSCGRELTPGRRACAFCNLRDAGATPSPEAIRQATLQLRDAYGLARDEDHDETPERERWRRELIMAARDQEGDDE